MSGFIPHQFQLNISELAEKRFSYYNSNALSYGDEKIPFFQQIDAITGSGKTVMLAHVLTLIATYNSQKPIVVWTTKSKAVVEQTKTNLRSADKYKPLLPDFEVVSLDELKTQPTLLDIVDSGLIVVMTTAKFNKKDGLNVHKISGDTFGNKSLWACLKGRSRAEPNKDRPLIVVYDEGHNLSDQQAKLLLELDPTFWLTASATMAMPTHFNNQVLEPLKSWYKRTVQPDTSTLLWQEKVLQRNADAFLSLKVTADEAVAAGLLKRGLHLAGLTSTMEDSVDQVCAKITQIENRAHVLGIPVRPKAIYVCNTNMNDDDTVDDPSAPLEYRKAPPIQIWKYLTEVKGVPPQEIGIYADLKFSKDAKPEPMKVFGTSDDSYDTFICDTEIRHIIFNKALQEGWDDPEVYVAYIDKSLGSQIQATQIIGRVLRQPPAGKPSPAAFNDALLDTAEIFIRVDEKAVFEVTLQEIKSEIETNAPGITIISSFSTKDSKLKNVIKPRPEQVTAAKMKLVAVDSSKAKDEITQLVLEFPIFEENSVHSKSEGYGSSAAIDLSNTNGNVAASSWKKMGSAGNGKLRWLLRNALAKHSMQIVLLVDMSDHKFDMSVQFGSYAHKQVEELARKIANKFWEKSILLAQPRFEHTFDEMYLGDCPMRNANGLYEHYSGLNPFENDVARELDLLGCLWHRNPSMGGFATPLLAGAVGERYFPDFILWLNNKIALVDTKGKHLLTDALNTKMFNVQMTLQGNPTARVSLYHGFFLSQGEYDSSGIKLSKGEKGPPYSLFYKMENGNNVVEGFNELRLAVDRIRYLLSK